MKHFLDLRREVFGANATVSGIAAVRYGAQMAIDGGLETHRLGVGPRFVGGESRQELGRNRGILAGFKEVMVTTLEDSQE
jgi:hypothetical protein